jgi:hypothetical protein
MNNNGIRLLGKLAGLPGAVNLGDYRPTDAAEEVYADLTDRIEAEIAKFDDLVKTDVAAFNASLASAKHGGVVVG